MSTITNNKLTDERPDDEGLELLITTRREIAERHASEGRMGQCAVHTLILNALLELQERRQADSAEPACYALTNMAGEVYNTHSSAQNAGAYRDLIHQSDDSLTLRVTPLYAAPPASVTGIYDDVLNIIGLLENNEWAEHCTSTVLGSLLESEITRLVSKEQPAPVVPPAIEPDYKVIKSILPTANPDEYACCIAADMWNACRSAMLNGGKS